MFSENVPTQRAAQKAATRVRILYIARGELERLGYERTNLRDIAKAAGVSTGTVLLHFKDKADLLHAALFDDLEATWTAAREAESVGAIEEDLVALARAFFDYYARRPALFRSLLRESMFASEPWSLRFAAQVAEVHAHVARLVLAAQARGELRGEADPAVVGAAFLSFYYFALIAWVQAALPDPMPMFQSSLRQHLNGLRP